MALYSIHSPFGLTIIQGTSKREVWKQEMQSYSDDLTIKEATREDLDWYKSMSGITEDEDIT